MKLVKILVCLVVATVFVSGAANAAILTQWGASALTSTRLGTDVFFGPDDGGPQESFAESSISNFVGNGRAEATLFGGTSLNVPLLRAEAYSSGGGRRAQSIATGIEGYTYIGDTPKVFSLTSTLTASVNDPTDDFRTEVLAPVYLFGEDGFFFSTDLPTLIYESDATVIGFMELSVEQTEDNAVRTGTINFTLSPGQSVYLWTQLFAQGFDGGSADAFGTLTNEFADSTGLVAASQEPSGTIPEPSTIAVWSLLGLVGLGYGWRKRKAA